MLSYICQSQNYMDIHKGWMGSLDESAQISFCPVLLIIITILIIYVTWVQVRCQNVAVYRWLIIQILKLL